MRISIRQCSEKRTPYRKMMAMKCGLTLCKIWKEGADWKWNCVFK